MMANPTNPPHLQRPIRSFVLRAGRMTAGQKKAFDSYWPRWGLAVDNGLLDTEQMFGRRANTILEIGFGMGQSLVAMAKAQPEYNFIGVEVHRAGIGRLLHSIAEQGVDNIRMYCCDAKEVLAHCIADSSLHGIQIFFPDPWHKKKHHKRRLIEPKFVQQLHTKLTVGGTLHLATDWQPYAEQMMQVLSTAPGWCNQAGEGCFTPRPAHRPITAFEQRGQRLGHQVWDLVFCKK